jgi:signal transduction histidine kinase/YesN/AraC family two-component response regulator
MEDMMHALPNILFVDDEEDNLLVFKASFRREYNIYTASSAAEGIKALEHFTPDIIISDQRMPHLNGVEFLSNLPDEPINIRIILSGFSDTETIIKALNKGKIYQYHRKPWEKAEMIQILKDAMKELEHRKSLNKQDQVTPKVAPLIMQSKASDQDDPASLRIQVSEAYKNIQLLSEIGREIISNLSINSIIESTYANVNALMDATVFAIGVYDDAKENIQMTFMERGKKLPIGEVFLNEDKPAAWTFKSRKEFMSNDIQNDFSKYSSGKPSAVVGDLPESLIYLPLETKEKVIGVISVQSFNRNAYTNYHLNILRNIAIYVATALENAKAYQLIELHKKEVEEKKNELEQKVELRTEELQAKNLELESTHSNIKLISKIGQQITSTLSLEDIVERVYENVNNLMDATIFSIGVFKKDENKIEFKGAIENGNKLPDFSYSMEDENRAAIWCLKNKQEMIINDFQKEYNKYIKNIGKPVAGKTPESLVYLPLLTNDGIVGTLSVQSYKKHIYNFYHIDLLRSLASYITIAIQNSTSYTRMTEAFQKLKSAQGKLVESEKMASLGVLTAGVAHEINNPVNFISGGIESVNENFGDLKKILKLIESPESGKSPEELWESIRSASKKLDLKGSIDEMDMLIQTIRNGALRTSEIVKGLRNFTRLDEVEMKKASLVEGIENTLAILNNKLKNRIEVIKKYEEIPDILCYPGQLNQVFMNILGNASDAIVDEGNIHIAVFSKDKQVVITIKDSGTGMPEEVMEHIFEPFYTTKEVGDGTGLGLSISYGIIEKHNGKIEVESEPGKGTTFIISLPIQ